MLFDLRCFLCSLAIYRKQKAFVVDFVLAFVCCFGPALVVVVDFVQHLALKRGREPLDEFAARLEALQKQRHDSEQDEFWKGHPRFQVPHRVLALKGKAEAQLLLYFYERAESLSFYCDTSVILEIKVTMETLCARTGLGNQAVSQAIRNLDGKYINVVRRRNAVTGQWRVSVYLLLHSQSKEPLTTTPQTYGVCRANFEQSYVTVTKDHRKVLNTMTPTGRQVCLSVLAVASRKMLTSFAINKGLLVAESGLKPRMFRRGFKECREHGLFTYARHVLVLNDPKTRLPSVRGQRDSFIEHEAPKWKFDLNGVTPEQWRYVVEKLLKCQFIFGSNDTWSKTVRGNLCPFCKQPSAFSVSFKTAAYRCHFEECGELGRLGKLVQRLMCVKKMHQVKTFIQGCIGELEAAKVAA